MASIFLFKTSQCLDLFKCDVISHMFGFTLSKNEKNNNIIAEKEILSDFIYGIYIFVMIIILIFFWYF